MKKLLLIGVLLGLFSFGTSKCGGEAEPGAEPGAEPAGERPTLEEALKDQEGKTITGTDKPVTGSGENDGRSPIGL